VPWREKLLAPKPPPQTIDAALIEWPGPGSARSQHPSQPPAPVASSRMERDAVHRKPSHPSPVTPARIEEANRPIGSENQESAPLENAVEAPSGGLQVSTAGSSARGLPGSSDAGSAAAEDDSLARIQALLAARAAHCYPAAAARIGLTGITRVRFCVRAGVPSEISIAQGSGEALLDRAASECVVGQAGPLPSVERCLEVPVRFERR
jgi:outer membrane biosynthesis protein TonB